MGKEKSVVFWGARGHAKVLRECIGYYGYKLIALFDNDRSLSSPFKDVPLYFGVEGFFRWFSGMDTSNSAPIHSVVAIGGALGRDRHLIQKFFERQGLPSAGLVHPTAFCASDVNIENGCQILAHATVAVDVHLGESCIINTAANIDHECVLMAGVHVCPGSHIAGEVRIDAYSMIGTGATILPGVHIGENVIVGAGSVVTRDVRNNVVISGNPARILRKAVQK